MTREIVEELAELNPDAPLAEEEELMYYQFQKWESLS